MAEPMPCLKALKYPLKFKYLSVTICKQNIRVISCDLNKKKYPAIPWSHFNRRWQKFMVFVISPAQPIYILNKKKFRETYLFYINWKPTHQRKYIPANKQTIPNQRTLSPTNLNDFPVYVEYSVISILQSKVEKSRFIMISWSSNILITLHPISKF